MLLDPFLKIRLNRLHMVGIVMMILPLIIINLSTHTILHSKLLLLSRNLLLPLCNKNAKSTLASGELRLINLVIITQITDSELHVTRNTGSKDFEGKIIKPLKSSCMY